MDQRERVLQAFGLWQESKLDFGDCLSVHHTRRFALGGIPRYDMADTDAKIARLTALGYPLLQRGRGFGVDGDGAYACFDSDTESSCISEAFAPPCKTPEPEYRFPKEVNAS